MLKNKLVEQKANVITLKNVESDQILSLYTMSNLPFI